MKLYWIILITSVCLFIASCGLRCTKNKSQKETNTHPSVDSYVGTPEKDILEHYGKPSEMHIKPANELIGELRTPIKSKIPKGKEDTLVKEFVYELNGKVKFFWLIDDDEQGWKVIDDITVPKGVLF